MIRQDGTIEQNQERVSNDLELKRAMLNRNAKPKVNLKQVHKWKFPHAAEMAYRKQLFKIVDIIEDAVKNQLISQLPRLQKELNLSRPQIKNDAYLDNINAIMESMRIFIDKKEPSSKLTAQTVGLEVSQFNRGQMSATLKKAFGVDIFTHEPWLSDQMDLFSQQNIDLIKDLTDKSLKDIKGVVTRGFASGTNLKDMTEQIQAQGGITKRRAKFIARDQTSKLNGQLTQLRQTENGAGKYQWLTAGDERVRPSHAEKEGKIYSWNNPPADTGHPGSDFNCRCTAIPVMDDLI